jgi:hypothetical protein
MTEAANNETKLYAGKFKTVEELEAGYKNSLPTFQENEQLKAKVAELGTVPDAYINPADVELDQNRVADIQARAKAASMTQAQYEKYLRNEKARMEKNTQTYETMKKEVGDETLQILKDYVGKHYPAALQENMINTFIVNKEARAAALEHRTQLLNNQVPGMSKTPASGYHVSDEDVKNAFAAKEKNRNDFKARNAYLNILAARAAQKRA